MTKEDIFARVSTILAEYLRLDAGEVRPESHIIDDLGADSLAMVELGFKFMETFKIGMLNPDPDTMLIGSLVDRIHQELTGN